MQNITQTIKFPVSSVLPSPIPEDVQALLIKVRQAKQTADREKLSNDLAALVSTKMSKELETFGASRLEDDISVNMQLGTVLFDIYVRMTPEPEAPLGKLIWRKKCTELAEVLDANEFSLPEYAAGPIRRALMDETVWKSLSLSVWVELPLKDGENAEDNLPKRYYFTINSQGVAYFNKVLEAAAELVYSEDLKEAK